jgi:hypothetical protein
MMNRITLNGLRLGALALSLSASFAQAGIIDIKPAAGDGVVAMLNGESKLFANAYRAMIVDRKLAQNARSSAWRRIQYGAHSPTVVRMEYTFVKNGRTHTRIYHARSGPAMEVVLSRIDLNAPAGGSRSGSSGTSGTESEGSRPYEITDEDIAKDFAERKYYPIDTELNVRVPNLPAENSVIQPTIKIHDADAELKIFRQIESDIATKTVTRGGKLVGYVSKAVCQSCGPAAEDLAEAFDISGTIHQMVEPEVGGAPARDPLLRASNEASTELKALRKSFATSQFKRGAVTAPGETSWAGTEVIERIQRIEAEEVRTALAEACGD